MDFHVDHFKTSLVKLDVLFITASNGTTPRGMAWTTPIDKLFNEKIFFYVFVGIIVGTTALTLFSDSPIGKTDVRKQAPFDRKSHGECSS